MRMRFGMEKLLIREGSESAHAKDGERMKEGDFSAPRTAGKIPCDQFVGLH